MEEVNIFDPFTDYQYKEAYIVEFDFDDFPCSIIYGLDIEENTFVVVFNCSSKYVLYDLTYEEAEEYAHDVFNIVKDLYEDGQDLEYVIAQLEEIGFEEV